MPTIKLYDDMPYTTGFTAKIIDVIEDLTDDIFSFFYAIVLDRTLFFPEQGGQSCDLGTLHIQGEKHKVKQVSINEKGEILHYISTTLPLPKKIIGKEIAGNIDWEHRFSNMQQHSGEHIISGLVKSLFGFQNVGFHLSNNIVTADFDGFLNENNLHQIESKANEIIYKNLEIHCYYPSADALNYIEYRSKGELNSEVRLVDIQGVDVCACCCPHVKSTGEIGLLKIISGIRYKGGTRLSFLCGKRAVQYFSSLLKQSLDISQYLSVERDALLPAIQALNNEKDRLKQQVSELNIRLLDSEAKEAMFVNNHPLVFVENYAMTEMRASVNKLIKASKIYCGIFSGNDEDGYTFVLGSKDLDCTPVSKLLTDRFDAKGGGRKEMIQGFVKGKKKDIVKAILSLY